MNIENFRLVLNQIKLHPETWTQTSWHCGTTHCFAGWCQVITGNEVADVTTRRDARIFLDLTAADADYLFDYARTIQDFEEILRFHESTPGGFDRGGHNLAARNRNGYNWDGYNRDGYNRSGYDRDGYNQDGLDWNGFDQDGYNRNGLDRDGFDRDGYHLDGYNLIGFDMDGLDKNNKPKKI